MAGIANRERREVMVYFALAYGVSAILWLPVITGFRRSPHWFSIGTRVEILRDLKAYFARVDAQHQPASPEEADAIIDEALRSTRPNYRPVR